MDRDSQCVQKHLMLALMDAYESAMKMKFMGLLS